MNKDRQYNDKKKRDESNVWKLESSGLPSTKCMFLTPVINLF